jgi:hypothetical protein
VVAVMRADHGPAEPDGGPAALDGGPAALDGGSDALDGGSDALDDLADVFGLDEVDALMLWLAAAADLDANAALAYGLLRGHTGLAAASTGLALELAGRSAAPARSARDHRSRTLARPWPAGASARGGGPGRSGAGRPGRRPAAVCCHPALAARR